MSTGVCRACTPPVAVSNANCGARTRRHLPWRASRRTSCSLTSGVTAARAWTSSAQLLDGVLRVRLNDQPRLPVFPLAGQADRFAYDVVAAELQFERQADGLVQALVLYQDGRRISVPRVE